MALTIEPLSPALGAEVVGLDLRPPMDRTTVQEIEEAWHQHIVLVFRDQSLSEAEQFRFARNFGELGTRKRKREDRPEGAAADHLMLVTNIRRNGVPIGSLPDGEMLFHHDMCYTPEPHKATFLYAIEVTRDGGHTLFANMYRAYDLLSPALKAKLAGRKVLQIYQYDPRERVDLGKGVDNFDHCWQPAVVRHPATGRTALYVNQLMSAAFDGLSPEESRAVLDHLWEINGRRDIVYEHVWRVGDLVMWDNRCSTHARTDFPTDQTRLLRRCTVAGDAMIPA
jgi:taurine dioxygenase